MSDTGHRFKVGDKVKLNAEGLREWHDCDIVRLKATHGIISRLASIGNHKPYYNICWFHNTENGKVREFYFAVYEKQVELLSPAFNLTLASPVDNIDEIIRLAELVSKTTNLDVKIEKVPPG